MHHGTIVFNRSRFWPERCIIVDEKRKRNQRFSPMVGRVTGAIEMVDRRGFPFTNSNEKTLEITYNSRHSTKFRKRIKPSYFFSFFSTASLDSFLSFYSPCHPDPERGSYDILYESRIDEYSTEKGWIWTWKIIYEDYIIYSKFDLGNEKNYQSIIEW